MILSGLPEPATVRRSKSEIALCELGRHEGGGAALRHGADGCEGYGISTAFRRSQDARSLRRAVGIIRKQKIYASDVRLFPPPSRARKPVPLQEPRDAKAVLADLPRRRVVWRQGTEGRLSARLAALRVRGGAGPA